MKAIAFEYCMDCPLWANGNPDCDKGVMGPGRKSLVYEESPGPYCPLPDVPKRKTEFPAGGGCRVANLDEYLFECTELTERLRRGK
jgi:hypothetical protein